MSEQRRPLPWWAWLLTGLLLVALVAAVLYWWAPISQWLPTREQVTAWVDQMGAWGPLAIILLELTQALLAPIPGQAIEAVSGYLFGPWLGVLFPLIGMALGSFLLFLLARRWGRPLLIKLIGRKSMDRLDDLVRRGGAPFFFLIWLLPFAPDDLACAAAGLTPMSPRQFLILMLLGRLPGLCMSVWVGANVTRIDPIWWAVLLAGIALVALVIWRKGEQVQEAILALIERVSDHFK